MSTWTFLSNHAHVLLVLAQSPDARVRDVAVLVGITERAVQRILRDLSTEGYISVTKEGRRNHYDVRGDRPLRHPVERGVCIRELLGLLEHSGSLQDGCEQRGSEDVGVGLQGDVAS